MRVYNVRDISVNMRERHSSGIKSSESQIGENSFSIGLKEV
jgi:hypothetical protein